MRIPRDAIEDYDGRIEYWDARNEAAFIAEPTTTYHEYGAQRLARLVERIAMRRGSPIDVIGASDLAVRDTDGTRQRLLNADQVVYLHPAATRPRGKEIERGADHLPDVVLEVDYSTDARRRKLGIYESWGFPEVWIEVPDASWSYRPKSRRSGVTIHLLEGGRYVEAASSRAFPGWTAEEIHRALNESAVSATTVDVLRRVADALAAVEGTGPDDDPLLRRERAEGRAGGRAEERLDIVRSAVRDAFAARALAIYAGSADVARRSRPGPGRGRDHPPGLGMRRRRRLRAPGPVSDRQPGRLRATAEPLGSRARTAAASGSVAANPDQDVPAEPNRRGSKPGSFTILALLPVARITSSPFRIA